MNKVGSSAILAKSRTIGVYKCELSDTISDTNRQLEP